MAEVLAQKSGVILGYLLGSLLSSWLTYGLLVEKHGKKYAKRVSIAIVLSTFLGLVLYAVIDSFSPGSYLLALTFPLLLLIMAIYNFYCAFAWRRRLRKLGEKLVCLGSVRKDEIISQKIIAIFMSIVVLLILLLYVPGDNSSLRERIEFYFVSISALALFSSGYAFTDAKSNSKSYVCEHGLFYETQATKWEEFLSYSWEREEEFILCLEFKKASLNPKFFRLVINPPSLRHELESALQEIGVAKAQDEKVAKH